MVILSREASSLRTGGLESCGLELSWGNSSGWMIGDTCEEETVLITGHGEEVITERLLSIGFILVKSIWGNGDDVIGNVGLGDKRCFGDGV